MSQSNISVIQGPRSIWRGPRGLAAQKKIIKRALARLIRHAGRKAVSASAAE